MSDALLRRDDARARSLAQREFARPLLLEAGAGTGKTATLVARVLAWALGPGWERAEQALARGAGAGPARIAARVLDRVVAITFTDAAAAEMARRVDEALASLVEGALPVGVDAEALPAPPLRAARAGALRAALDHLQVQTIHAWCRRLLASFPLAAGVHPAFQVDAGGRAAAEAARAALEARLRDAYTRQERAALALAERGIGPAELEEALASLLERGVRAAELRDRDPAAPECIAALAARLRAALVALRDAGVGALAGVLRHNAAKLAQALAASLADADEVATREQLAALAESLRAWFPQPLRDLLKRWGERGDFNRAESEAFGSGAAAVARAAAELSPLVEHVALLDLALLDDARALLGAALGDAEQELRRRGWLGFAQLLDGAARLLAEHAEVAAALRAGIDQLLVDEFQDTDRRQCAIVGALALEGDGPHPGLFLVGDPKQSIYGWREADLAAYEGFAQRVQGAGGELARLSVNYRSVRSVLAEVERVVAPVMQPRPGLQPAFQPLVARPDASDGLPVEYWLPARLDAEAGALAKTSAAEASALEARALARRLRALHEGEGVAWGEMAVLTRSRGDWDVYLEALREQQIPFRVEGDRSYYRRREIIEAAAWVRCVLDPGDVLALVAALRSSAVGVPDAAWLPLFAIGLPARAARLEGEAPAELAALVRDVAAVAGSLPPEVPGIERVRGWEHNLAAALAAIARLRALFEREAPDVFVEALRDALLFEASEAARFLGPWRAANLERFFRGLSSQLAEGAAPAEVLRALRRAVAEEEPSEEMQPRDLEADGVRVLTLHGAKGLDFGCVFLVQLHKASGRRPPELEAAEWEGRLEYRLLGAATPGFDRVLATRRQVVDAERVRLLYVGMTRARTRLVLSGLWTPFLVRGGDGLVRLLESRDGAPDWTQQLARCRESGASVGDTAGARWRLLALEQDVPPPARAASPRGAADVAAWRAEARALGEASQRARAHMARPRGGRASELWRDDGDEARPVREPAHAPEPGVPGALARWVGVAVHRALEELDLFAPDPQRELARVREGLEAALAAHAPPSERAAAARAAGELLARFGRGPLHARLLALREHVVARELPVLVAPAADDLAQGFVAGSIDLVHRDPATGEWVVVDYKTDRVGPEGLAAERRAEYTRQGAAYQRALQQALALPRPPRFELWLLASDTIA